MKWRPPFDPTVGWIPHPLRTGTGKAVRERSQESGTALSPLTSAGPQKIKIRELSVSLQMVTDPFLRNKIFELTENSIYFLISWQTDNIFLRSLKDRKLMSELASYHATLS